MKCTVTVHIRDPQFYALPATTRAANGNIRVMGFPPIGIMCLSAVLKQAGHDSTIFDQANPETLNAVARDARKDAAELTRTDDGVIGAYSPNRWGNAFACRREEGPHAF